MKRIFLAASLVLSSVTAAFAGDGTTTFDCDIKVFTNNGWIAPRIIVSLDSQEQVVEVYDGIIHTVYGEPIAGKVTPRSEKAVDLAWYVDGIPVGNVNTTAKAQYYGVLNKQTQTLSVRAHLAEFRNAPRGRGKCKVTQGITTGASADVSQTRVANRALSSKQI
ncbi:hypothetical protein [Leisingera sp. ANG-Vp]|uniref:hypothetical protein n=1 Tax=Leisingera sp. ANG-Vp TaxID=1577896 RepID=UPI00057C3A6A|nr:hypothetical protein [Leisingera sp. ANG-Vp]KIC17587.1 hypothetical protein RA20_14600 [Leisingera sp. ANG-Vp]